MDIRVDAGSALPPYEQVRSQFAAQIVAGALVVGERLPTVRRLATELGVATNTVARAYRELETAGLIETHGRGGSVVASAGDDSRRRARAAAQAYATAVGGLGLPADEALAIVRAALADGPGADG